MPAGRFLSTIAPRRPARAVPAVIVSLCRMITADVEVDLVERSRTGDRAAFEELVRRTSGYLFARLYLETGDPHRSEDLLQETYLSAYRALPGLANQNGFRSWLWSIAQHAVIDAARHDQRKKRQADFAGPTALQLVAGSQPTPDESAEKREERDRVLGILRSLPEEYRLPLTLRYLGGADYESIQLQLGLTNGSLRGLLHRGLKLLREKLGEPGA